MSETTTQPHRQPELPGLDCGLCGVRTCGEMAARLETHPELARALHPSRGGPRSPRASGPGRSPARLGCWRRACRDGEQAGASRLRPARGAWRDTLGREFDFYLEHFPEDPGPREMILPHNPLLTREMDIRRGDILIGRPLGMSCGCPITHCGVVADVDPRTGVIVWCVTGPLGPRAATASRTSATTSPRPTRG